MGAHPEIVWQPVLAAASDVFGKGRQRFAMLIRRTQRRVELSKAEPSTLSRNAPPPA